MKLSQNFTKTSKDIPAGEVSKNAQSLIRAGYIHKAMPGVYAFLPLGLRVLNKLEDLVRKNMNAVGGQEILMNTLHPKKWWEQANRWNNVDILFKLNSQTGSEYAIACSHEEQVVPIASTYISSYKDLPDFEPEKGQFPLSVYQIQTKFRDELRAKSGILRGREFRMKDMYDFHTNSESQNKYYDVVKNQYLEFYKEIGLEAFAVQASGGIFTTNISHEFQVACDAGEDWTYLDPSTKEAYNKEMAPVKANEVDYTSEEEQVFEDRIMPNIIGVKELTKELNIPETKTTKTIFFTKQDGKMIGAVIRGDRNVNEEKLANIAKSHIRLSTYEEVKAKTGVGIGYAGVIDLPSDIEVFYDKTVEKLKNFETGSNKEGGHAINVCFGRDVPIPSNFYDIIEVKEGDKNPESGAEYEIIKTAEVGNIFKLDDKYTKAFGVTFMNSENKTETPLMNCHGIGTTRCMGVVADVYSDEKGLKWPKSIAPYHFHIITHLTKDDEEINEKILKIANKIYNSELKLVQNADSSWKIIDPSNIDDITHYTFEEIENMSRKNEILWDDRKNIGIGEKFKDADLIGIPYQVIITKKTIESGEIFEIKDR